MGARLLTGFLTLFIAFLMREHPIPGYSGTLVLALVVGAAGGGNALGTVVGNAARRLRPERLVAAALLVIVAASLTTAVAYSLVTLLVLGLCAGLCAQVIKLSTDAIIQRDVAENVRTQVFAWSETVLQIAWVFGGGLGIALPLVPRLGFGVISGLLVVVLLLSIQVRRQRF
jgi:predicted MFS family arabinose efflux permease